MCHSTERKTKTNHAMKMLPVTWLLIILLPCPWSASAQLAVKVCSPTVAGNKAAVQLVMKNNFTEKIQSARAVLFLLDDHGEVIGRSTKWVLGGGTYSPGLAAGATNTFYFVVQSPKPFTTTNLTGKVMFSRVTLEGGKSLNPNRDVMITK
jgi:hypothetical protein